MILNSIQLDSTEFNSNIKQNWLKIYDMHLDGVVNVNDLVDVIQSLYRLNDEDVLQQMQDWESNQINVDGHIYQSKFDFLN